MERINSSIQHYQLNNGGIVFSGKDQTYRIPCGAILNVKINAKPKDAQLALWKFFGETIAGRYCKESGEIILENDDHLQVETTEFELIGVVVSYSLDLLKYGGNAA